MFSFGQGQPKADRVIRREEPETKGTALNDRT